MRPSVLHVWVLHVVCCTVGALGGIKRYDRTMYGAAQRTLMASARGGHRRMNERSVERAAGRWRHSDIPHSDIPHLGVPHLGIPHYALRPASAPSSCQHVLSFLVPQRRTLAPERARRSRRATRARAEPTELCEGGVDCD